MNSNNVMNFVKPTEDVLEVFSTKLAALTEADESATFADVVIYPGTSEEELFDYVPELQLPAAVIVYKGSEYDNSPLRTLKVSVLTLAEAVTNSEMNQTRVYIDKVCSALDREVDSYFHIRVSYDRRVTWDYDTQNIATHEVVFKVEDH